jgi:hypothetical protein
MRARLLRPFLIVAVTFAAGGFTTVGGAENSSNPDKLALLRARNIFDPNRRPDRPSESRRESAAPAPAETLSLIGAMLHEGRAFSFFDGSNAGFRQVLSTGEMIASMRIEGITTSGVELKEENGTVHWLPVGGRLRRVGLGAWSVADGTQTAEEPRRVAESASRGSATDTPAATGPSDEADAILKRMMERRRQEESR